MAGLVFVVSDLGPHAARVVDLLRREFGVSIPAVGAAVRDGRPVAERRLFDRRDPAATPRLVGVLEGLGALGCEYRAWQLLDGDSYVEGATYYELTPERLRNEIEAREQSMADQWRYAELRGETE